MKKLFLLALTSAAFAGLASAATVSAFCGSADVTSFTTGTPVTSPIITCPSFLSLSTPGGSVYTDSTLSTLSFVTGIILQPTGVATMAYSGGGFTFNPVSFVVQSNTGQVAGTSNTLVGIGSAAAFNVTYDVTQTSANGSVGASTGSVAVTYNYTTPQGSVPEPATFGLLGGSLVGLGLIARRKRKA